MSEQHLMSGSRQESPAQADDGPGGSGNVAWEEDLENFAIPAGRELPQEVERLIRNQRPVQDRYDARKWQYHYLSGDKRFDAFIRKYEFRHKYRMAGGDGSNDFIGTFYLRGADDGEGQQTDEMQARDY